MIGLVVTGTYSDGSTKTEGITAAKVTGFNSAVVATDQVLTITDGAKTTTYKVQIVAEYIPDTNGMTEMKTTQSAVEPYFNSATKIAVWSGFAIC